MGEIKNKSVFSYFKILYKSIPPYNGKNLKYDIILRYNSKIFKYLIKIYFLADFCLFLHILEYHISSLS